MFARHPLKSSHNADNIPGFSRHDYSGPPLKDFLDIIAYVKPTALLGLSTIHVSYVFLSMDPDSPWCQGAFTPAVLKAMADLNPRPIVFPLSNPVKLSECTFEEAIEHTTGTALFASGSPFPELPRDGKTLHPGQGNNMYIFPGWWFPVLRGKMILKRCTEQGSGWERSFPRQLPSRTA
jgi:malate dehydrogenase (oxaloacetate-decarboxylating)(NADP+)